MDDAIQDELGTSPREGGARPPQKVRYTHDAMIDLMIAQPGISQNALAKHFGYTASWVSTIISSDAFQARLAARRAEVVDPIVSFSIEEKMKGLVDRSLEVLQEKLSAPAAVVPDNLALRAAELGAKALGLGGNAPAPAIPTDHLNTLASRLLSLRADVYSQPALEGVSREVKE